MISEGELRSLEVACRSLPMVADHYVAKDLVLTLQEMVLDYRQTSLVVQRALEHYKSEVWSEVRSLDDLERVFHDYDNDKDGNLALAQFLWGYNLWTRAEQLRGVVEWSRRAGINSMKDLSEWIESSTFADFEHQIDGLGLVVYQGLVMRLGGEAISPDVHVTRFVHNTISRNCSEADVNEALCVVANRIGMKTRVLDASIWDHQTSTDE